MSRLTKLFKEGDTELGVFYPNHYLLAVFRNFSDADRAKKDLTQSGRADDDVICASGNDVIHFAEDHRMEDGLLGLIMTAASRIFGTEAVYADKDLAAAHHGAAFLAVYCPTEKLKLEAWKTIEADHPLVARYYSSGGIEHLLGQS